MGSLCYGPLLLWVGDHSNHPANDLLLALRRAAHPPHHPHRARPHHLAIWGAASPTIISASSAQTLTAMDSPKPHSTVLTAGKEPGPIWAKSKLGDYLLMPGQGFEQTAIAHAPQPNSSPAVPGSQKLPIRGEADAGSRLGVTGEGYGGGIIVVQPDGIFGGQSPVGGGG